MFSVLASVKVDDPLLRVRIAAADARAENARQMVLARDTKLAALQAAADQLPTTQQAAATEHAQLWAAINALQGKGVTKQEKRVTTAQVLALGASVDLTVTWTTPFADASYLAIPLLDASAGIANVNPPAIKSQTATGCVVTVRANVAVAAGLAVNVVGLRFG